MADPTRRAVLKRMREYRKNEVAFLREHADRTWTRDWFVLYDDELHDAKAIWASAFSPPRRTVTLNTRDARSGLRALGFEVISKSGAETYTEGKRLYREATYFARNAKLVSDAKQVHGTRCMACGFDFEAQYGSLGKDYVEMHHLHPMAMNEIRNSTITDVIVLCANCHRMIERRESPLSLNALKRRIRKKFSWPEIKR